MSLCRVTCLLALMMMMHFPRHTPHLSLQRTTNHKTYLLLCIIVMRPLIIVWGGSQLHSASPYYLIYYFFKIHPMLILLIFSLAMIYMVAKVPNSAITDSVIYHHFISPYSSVFYRNWFDPKLPKAGIIIIHSHFTNGERNFELLEFTECKASV